jgi:hypothetical protein
MKKIKLLDNQINTLVAIPESGMGYHIVDIKLYNGIMLTKKVVLNSQYLQLEENELLDPSQIEEIRIHN